MSKNRFSQKGNKNFISNKIINTKAKQPSCIQKQDLHIFNVQFNKMIRKRQSYCFQILKQFILFSDTQSQIIPNYKFMRWEVEKSYDILENFIKRSILKKKIDAFINLKIIRKPKLEAYYKSQNIEKLLEKIFKLSDKQQQLIYKIVVKFLKKHMKEQRNKQKYNNEEETFQNYNIKSLSKIQEIQKAYGTQLIKSPKRLEFALTNSQNIQNLSKNYHENQIIKTPKKIVQNSQGSKQKQKQKSYGRSSQRKSSKNRNLRFMKSIPSNENTPNALQKFISKSRSSFHNKTKTEQNTQISDFDQHNQSGFLLNKLSFVKQSKILSNEIPVQIDQLSTFHNEKTFSQMKKSQFYGQIQKEDSMIRQIKNDFNFKKKAQENNCNQINLLKRQNNHYVGSIDLNASQNQEIKNQYLIISSEQQNSSCKKTQIKERKSIRVANQNQSRNQNQKLCSSKKQTNNKNLISTPQRIYIIHNSPSLKKSSNLIRNQKQPDQIIKIPIQSKEVDIIQIYTQNGRKNQILQNNQSKSIKHKQGLQQSASPKKKILQMMQNYYQTAINNSNLFTTDQDFLKNQNKNDIKKQNDIYENIYSFKIQEPKYHQTQEMNINNAIQSSKQIKDLKINLKNRSLIKNLKNPKKQAVKAADIPLINLKQFQRQLNLRQKALTTRQNKLYQKQNLIYSTARQSKEKNCISILHENQDYQQYPIKSLQYFYSVDKNNEKILIYQEKHQNKIQFKQRRLNSQSRISQTDRNNHYTNHINNNNLSSSAIIIDNLLFNQRQRQAQKNKYKLKHLESNCFDKQCKYCLIMNKMKMINKKARSNTINN